MMFKARFIPGIVKADITRTYRNWKRPQVKVGGIYNVQRSGTVRVTGLEQVACNRITDRDARASGFESRGELLAFIGSAPETLWCIRFEYQGSAIKPGPDRSALQGNDAWVALHKKLQQKDARSDTAWTLATLRAIKGNPGTSSAILATMLGQDQKVFKQDVRKLKALGLTISLETGYQLSERGQGYLDWLKH